MATANILNQPFKKLVLKTLGLAILPLFLSACEFDFFTQTEKPPLEADDRTKKYLSKTIQPLTQQEYPNLYRIWGNEWMQEINNSLLIAAERVHLQPDCDKVTRLMLSPSSELKVRPILLVTCENEEKYYVSLKDVSQLKPLLPVSQLFDKQPIEIINQCLEGIKPSLLHPDEVVVDDANTLFTRQPQHVELLMPFWVKTGFDTTTMLKAQCTMDASFNMSIKMVSDTDVVDSKEDNTQKSAENITTPTKPDTTSDSQNNNN